MNPHAADQKTSEPASVLGAWPQHTAYKPSNWELPNRQLIVLKDERQDRKNYFHDQKGDRPNALTFPMTFEWIMQEIQENCLMYKRIRDLRQILDNDTARIVLFLIDAQS